MFGSALPNISTSFPPKTLKMGTPKSEIGMGREIQVSVQFPQKPSVRVIPGNSFWGPHFQRFGGFSGGNENGQS